MSKKVREVRDNRFDIFMLCKRWLLVLLGGLVFVGMYSLPESANAQSCGTFTVTYAAGCDSNCNVITSTQNLNCNWDGASCTGYASDGGCFWRNGVCQFEDYGWAVIPCGGGGGGGGSGCPCGVNLNGNCRPCDITCTPQVYCPAGWERTSTVVSQTCNANDLCGSNAWGTGGSPGDAQAIGDCCRWETIGGGNCEWVSCPTPANPGKVCKVCDPSEDVCREYTLTTYECVSTCSATNPSSFTLSSPANGAQIANTNVSLLWNAVSSWGTSCAGTNQYQVFVDTNSNPTTVYSTVGEGVTQDVFVGSVGTTYYWKVRANNGSVYTDSEVRSFTIVQNQITGTIYIDNDGTCSQTTPGNLGGTLVLQWGSDLVAVNPDGTYTLIASGTGANTLLLAGLPAGYTCSPACGNGSCSISGVDPAVNGTGNTFYVTPSRGAWFQLEGAGAYAGSLLGGVTVRSLVPPSREFIIPGGVGAVASLMRASGDYDVESIGGGLSSTDWNAVTRYRGKTLDYAFFAAREGVALSQTNDWISDNMDQPADDGRDFWFIDPSGTAVISEDWSVTGGDSLVVFVDGDLRIENDVTVDTSSFLAFVVRGDVDVDPSVTSMQGMYVLDGTFTTESATPANDVQLVTGGSVVAWTGVQLSRDLGNGNIGSPAEKFVYRPDLLVNMPLKMKTYAMEWTEVVPGTFGD